MAWVSEDGGNEAANLLALCPTCHALHHRGIIPREAIYAWKQVLVTLSAAFDVETIDLMLFLHKMKADPAFLIQADTLVQFSRLIGNDLADFAWRQETVKNIFLSGYRVSLSNKGQHLIDAWMKGDRKDVAEALSLGWQSDATVASN
jgi:hypothetical protein